MIAEREVVQKEEEDGKRDERQRLDMGPPATTGGRPKQAALTGTVVALCAIMHEGC